MNSRPPAPTRDVSSDLFKQIDFDEATRVAYAISRDLNQAEEIVAIALLRAHTRMQSYDPTRPFRPWFFTILGNCALTEIRNRERWYSRYRTWSSVHPDLPDEAWEPADTRLDPATQVLEAEKRARIWTAVGQLSAGKRAAIVLKYQADLSEEEIAQALGCPIGTVKSRLADARKQLARVLPPDLNPYRSALSIAGGGNRVDLEALL